MPPRSQAETNGLTRVSHAMSACMPPSSSWHLSHTTSGLSITTSNVSNRVSLPKEMGLARVPSKGFRQRGLQGGRQRGFKGSSKGFIITLVWSRSWAPHFTPKHQLPQLPQLHPPQSSVKPIAPRQQRSHRRENHRGGSGSTRRQSGVA